MMSGAYGYMDYEVNQSMTSEALPSDAEQCLQD